MEAIQSARSILVATKCRFIGDTVVAVPLLEALRKTIPGARIGLLTGYSAQEALQECPYVDRFYPYDPAGQERGFRTFLHRMLSIRRDSRPDVCFLLNTSFRSALGGVLSGARIRIGWPTEGRRLLLTHPVPHRLEKPEMECYLDLLRAVIPESDPGMYSALPHLWVSNEERRRAGDLLMKRGIDGAAPLLAFHVKDDPVDLRSWSAARFIEVAQALAEKTGARVLLLGGPRERAASTQVADALGTRAVLLAGETSLRETMALLSLSRLWVGCDGGLLHLAVGVDTPTVGIFSPRTARGWSYQSARHCTVLGSWSGCPQTREEIREWMESITPGEVLEVAIALWRETETPLATEEPRWRVGDLQ